MQRSTTVLYDKAGNLLSQTTGIAADPTYAHPVTTTYGYDVLNRRVLTIEAFGDPVYARSTVTDYDHDSNVIKVLDPLGRVTSYAYDKLNRRIQTDEAANDAAVKRTTTMIYDATDNLLSLTTGFSTVAGYNHPSKTVYLYDFLNRPRFVIEAAGTLDARTSSTVYDADNNVVEVVDPLDHTTEYQYDGLNRRTRTDEASGTTLDRTTLTIYDAANNVREVTTGIAYDDPLHTHPSTTVSTYDVHSRRILVEEAVGTDEVRFSEMDYDLDDNLVWVKTGESDGMTEPHPSTTTYAYDALNRRTGETDAVNTAWVRSTTTVYDAANNVLRVIDPLSHTASTTYDVLNRPSIVVEAWNTDEARTTTMLYDKVDNLLSATTGLSGIGGYAHKVITDYAYDALNRRYQTDEAVGTGLLRSTVVVYDAANNARLVQTALGNFANPLTVSMTYDALNRKTFVEEAPGTADDRKNEFHYDGDDNILWQTTGLSTNPDYAQPVTTKFAYDELNRRTKVIEAYQLGNLERTTSTEYDAANNVVKVTDPLDHSTSFSYDALNRKTVTLDARGATTTTIYDAADNVREVIDADENSTFFWYDALNRKIETKDPVLNTATFLYDKASRLTSTTDRLGRRIDRSYDALNRLKTEIWVAADGTVDNISSFLYDAAGNVLQAGNNAGIYVMTYDDLNRLTSEQEPFGVSLVSMSYDAADNRTYVQDSLGGVTNSFYDSFHRLKSRQFSGAGQTPLRLDVTYTIRNEVATQTRFKDLNGNTKVGSSIYTYDVLGQLKEIQQKDGQGNVIEDYNDQYDSAGRLTHEARNGVDVGFDYDPTNELTKAGDAAFHFDLEGNDDDPGFVIDIDNRLKSDGTWNYEYDLEGNLITKTKAGETWTYGYDERNHLIWVEVHDGNGLVLRDEFIYDAFGNRVQKKVAYSGLDPLITRFAYDGANIWVDLDWQSQLTMRRLYQDGVDQLFARISKDGTAAWYLTDRLGSVRDIHKNQPAGDDYILDHIDYSAFGVVTESNANYGDRYKYTGREFDSETGLQYNRARYYDPKIGRWTSEDPLGFDAGDTNLNRYVNNEPTDMTDPSGLAGQRSETTDFSKIPVDRVESMVNDGLAQKHRGYVFIADVKGTNTYLMILEPYYKRDEFLGYGRNGPVRKREERSLADRKWTPTGNEWYRVVSYKEFASSVDEDPSVQIARFRRDTSAQVNIEGYISDKETANFNGLVGVINFTYHLLPFGAAWDSVAKGKFAEAAISAVGDVAMFLTGPLGAATNSGRSIRLVGMGLQAGVGATRASQGFFALRGGDNNEALGYLGEATLRLLGVGLDAIGALKAAKGPGGVDLEVYYKPEWTEAQRAAARQKVQALTQADTVVVTNPQRSGTAASSRYRQAGNMIPSGSDVDHTVDLQLSGADVLSNMNPLDASVNRSLGAQIQQSIKDLPAGTRINRITIGDKPGG